MIAYLEVCQREQMIDNAQDKWKGVKWKMFTLLCLYQGEKNSG